MNRPTQTKPSSVHKQSVHRCCYQNATVLVACSRQLVPQLESLMDQTAFL